MAVRWSVRTTGRRRPSCAAEGGSSGAGLKHSWSKHKHAHAPVHAPDLLPVSLPAAMAELAARAAAWRTNLLLCLCCLLLLASCASGSLQPEVEMEMEEDFSPTLFDVEAEDGQVGDVNSQDRDLDRKVESATVQRMKEEGEKAKGRNGLFWVQHPANRRRASEWGCAANPAICLDPTYYPAGPTCCNSRCVNTEYDNKNCGFCDNVCPFGTSCCIGLCVDTQSDSSNCGKCANECPPGNTCAFGFCGYGYS